MCLEPTCCATSCGHALCEYCDGKLRTRACPLCRAPLPGAEPWDLPPPEVVWRTEYPESGVNYDHWVGARLQRRPCPGGGPSRVGSYLARAAGAMLQQKPSRMPWRRAP